MKRERGIIVDVYIYKNYVNKVIHDNNNVNVIVLYYRSTNSVDTSDLNEASVASITISNESLAKSGESIVVSGKGMGSTVKVKTFLYLDLRLKEKKKLINVKCYDNCDK